MVVAYLGIDIGELILSRVKSALASCTWIPVGVVECCTVYIYRTLLLH